MEKELRHPMMHSLFLIAIFVTSLSGPALAADADTSATVIIMIRHAERDPGLDPPLNEKGLQRAEMMVHNFGNSGIEAIYVPDLIRNIQTVIPLAEHLGIKPHIIPKELLADTRKLARFLVDDILNHHAGGVVLFAGNQRSSIKGQNGNLYEFHHAIGAPGQPETRYENVNIYFFNGRDPVRCIKATY